MNKINAELLHFTPLEVALTAIGKPYKNENPSLKLLENIVNVKKHESVIEHISFNFNVDGFSRLCLQELVRHRIASYTAESTRYTLNKMIKDFEPFIIKYVFEEDNNTTFEINLKDKKGLFNMIDKYYVNPYCNLDKSLNGVFILENVHYCHIMNELVTLLSVKENLKGFENLGERIEDYMKYDLTESKRTSLVLTMNLRSVRNMFKLRISNFAHFEIRTLAKLLQNLIKEKTPYGNFVNF